LAAAWSTTRRGILLHLAAQRAWLAARGALPVNVKWIVEGEEETGSEHLAEFLREHRARLDCDVLVLSDTANLDTGIPSLTTSLRGIVQVDVTVRALDHPIHSGMWGGPVPDAATALTSLLARLVDADRAIAVPGIYDDAPELSAAEAGGARRAAVRCGRIPARCGDGARRQLHRRGRPHGLRTDLVPPGARTHCARGHAARDRREPADGRGARADRSSRRAGARRAAHRRPRVRLREARSAGRCAHRDVGERQCAGLEDARGRSPRSTRRAARCAPATGAMRRWIGCGGSIPFVGPFVEVLGGVPALLLGLEDPPCNAHGENESLDLADFAKAAHSSAHLLAELRDFAR
jgi:acetylornithine deacetylase/succinyl-diaminopimelate desuccinylase-like protein